MPDRECLTMLQQAGKLVCFQGALIYEAESGKLLALDRKKNKCVHAFLSHTQSKIVTHAFLLKKALQAILVFLILCHCLLQRVAKT